MDSLEAENSFLARTELSVLGSVIPNVARKKWGTCENLLIQFHPSMPSPGRWGKISRIGNQGFSGQNPSTFANQARYMLRL